MKINELRMMTLDELRARLDELSEDQFNLKFRLQTQPLDDPLRIHRNHPVLVCSRVREAGALGSLAVAATAVQHQQQRSWRP